MSFPKTLELSCCPRFSNLLQRCTGLRNRHEFYVNIIVTRYQPKMHNCLEWIVYSNQRCFRQCNKCRDSLPCIKKAPPISARVWNSEYAREPHFFSRNSWFWHGECAWEPRFFSRNVRFRNTECAGELRFFPRNALLKQDYVKIVNLQGRHAFSEEMLYFWIANVQENVAFSADVWY